MFYGGGGGGYGYTATAVKFFSRSTFYFQIREIAFLLAVSYI